MGGAQEKMETRIPSLAVGEGRGMRDKLLQFKAPPPPLPTLPTLPSQPSSSGHLGSLGATISVLSSSPSPSLRSNHKPQGK
jgi:hypothetical protein